MNGIVSEAEKSESGGGGRWPEEVRELAYQHWAFSSGRNAAATSRALKALGHDVDDRLVRYWASGGDWAQRAHDDLARLAPDIRRQTIAELIYGALEAAQGLRSMVRGETLPDKTLVAAYLGMLDRGGFSPVGSNAPELPKVSVAQAAEDFRSMSPEERLEAERRLRLGAGDLASTARNASGKRRS